MSARLSTLSRSIAGKVAIVTGAASGMGRATAHLFADEGARVVVADVGRERVDAVVDEITAVHGDEAALGIVCDVAELDELRSLVERTVEWAGRLDIVINNAGISLLNSAFQAEGEFETNWARTLDVNLTAHARLIRLAVPYMTEAGEGRIVNIASTYGLVASVDKSAYVAAVHGVIGLTRAVALENAKTSITCNAICPGWVLTRLTEKQLADEAARESISVAEAKASMLA
ncbi:MAG: SDR family NAD(P)-dependent oxidoreductase, partial [Ilumatobacteraceae bacterium]